MMKLTSKTALAAISLLIGLTAGPAVAATSAMKVALADSAHSAQAAERPLSVMFDQPSGHTFAYFADEGWKFSGRNEAAPVSDVASAHAAGQPLSLIVDGPTGFVYSYLVDKGWQFVGRIGDVGSGAAEANAAQR